MKKQTLFTALTCMIASSIAATHATAEEPKSYPSCSTPQSESIQALAQLEQDFRNESCENYEPSFERMKKGNDPVCGEFGLNKGETVRTFDDALQIDCDVLRFYQSPQPLVAHDPLNDLAQACMMRAAKIRLSLQLAGKDKKERTKARDEKLHRAEACAKQAIPQVSSLPLNQVSSALPWSNYLSDQEIIHESRLTITEQMKANELLEKGQLSVEGRKSPIHSDAMTRAFGLVIQQELEETKIQPTAGQTLNWSHEFKECVGKKFLPFTGFSKTLGALAIGQGMILTPTGHEKDLYDWMIQQPDRSIEPAELFRQSYRLNEGDIYRTILTIENLLSRAWQVKTRDQLDQTRKLKPFVRMIGPEADTYGSWYHFFGTMLHAYATRPSSARMVAGIEAAGSFGLDGKIEFQETHVNRSGAVVGGKLSRMIKDESWRQLDGADEEGLSFYTYVNTTEDLTRSIRKEIKKHSD